MLRQKITGYEYNELLVWFGKPYQIDFSPLLPAFFPKTEFFRNPGSGVQIPKEVTSDLKRVKPAFVKKDMGV
jgi:hypothetical protein